MLSLSLSLSLSLCWRFGRVLQPQVCLHFPLMIYEGSSGNNSFFLGNFYRIRSAFKFGARKLGWILSLSEEKMAEELDKFFANTLDSQRSNCLKNVVELSRPGIKVSDYFSHSSQSETFSEKNFVELAGCFKIQGIEVVSGLRNKPERYLLKTVSPKFVPRFVCRFDGDIKQPAASRLVGTRCANKSSGCFPVSTCLSTLVPVCSHRPYYCILGIPEGNGKVDNCGPYEETLAEYSATDDEMSSSRPLEHEDKHLVTNDLGCLSTNLEDMALTDATVLSDVTDVSKNMDHREQDNGGIFGTSEALKLLLDLGGDYDGHYRNLQYGQLCHAYARSGLAFQSPPLSPLLHNKNLWEPVQKSTQCLQSASPRSDRNGVPSQLHFPANNFSFGEENRKPRGMGTYFPKLVLRLFSIED